MLIDVTLKITKNMLADTKENTNKALIGHLGTHFDVMNKEFPLAYTKRRGTVFDVSMISDRDIDITDIDLRAVEKDMFVTFHTGYIEKVGYGEPGYFTHHPQLSHALINALIEKGVSVIGIDFAGVRRGTEHIPTDQRCADAGLFIIENLCNLAEILSLSGRFTAHTYPMRCEDVTGLPCRVIAELDDLST